MTCRDCVQIPPDVYGIDASIETQILKTPHYLLVHLAVLYYGRNPNIGTLKKERQDIFQNDAPKSLKQKS